MEAAGLDSLFGAEISNGQLTLPGTQDHPVWLQ